MKNPRIVIAGVVVAALAAAGGITAAASAGTTPAASTPAAGSSAVTVHTVTASVGGTMETILVDSHGLPLYYYQPDTAARSLVTGRVLQLWPAVLSATPTATGVSAGKLTSVSDAHGMQVAYNGHLLYTFVSDGPGQVTGQGVQNFFVATPGLTPLAGATAGTSSPAAPSPSPSPSPSSGGYSY